VTERAAIELLENEVRRRDATPRSTVIAFGPRTARSRARGSERALGAGDLIRLDAACLWRGFHAEVARTAVMGAPDARQETAFDAVLTGIEAALYGVRPGAIANQVFSKAVKALPAARGTDDIARDVGHGIGLEAREAPILDAESATPLETGMVLRLETRHDEPGRHGVQIKETVLVTPAGPRVMNRSRRGLVVLD
jgi:Xaa-Pro dipeptidase